MSAPVTEQAAALTVEATSRALHLPTVRQQVTPLARPALRDRLSHLANFDLEAAPTVDPAILAALEPCAWIASGEPVVLLGDSGTGSHTC